MRQSRTTTINATIRIAGRKKRAGPKNSRRSRYNRGMRDTMNDKPEMKGWRRARTAAGWITLIIVIAYFLSYMILGKHSHGGWAYTTPDDSGWRQFSFHRRSFPFNPWIYIPAAKIESMLRNSDTKVYLDGPPTSGKPTEYEFHHP
jgi:hypothetical protein